MQTSLKTLGNDTSITLNMTLYPSEYIYRAIEAYEPYAKISFEKNIITFTADNSRLIALEFCNFLLSAIAEDSFE